MVAINRPGAARRLGLIGCLAAICIVLGMMALGSVVSPAGAYCAELGCLPTTGYTIEETFNCGQIHSYDFCYANGTRIFSSATRHTYGFGSASYSGEGTALVFVAAEPGDGTTTFGMYSNGNLARSCYYNGCLDQEVRSLYMEVGNASYHTIVGHWKA